mgnify:CR=1 FL=1
MTPDPYEVIKWVESQVNGIGHTGGSFMSHLFGTYDILRSWGEDIGLCYAGLCHSLYETAYFKSDQLAGKISREDLAEVIGPTSEYLVYLFCNMPARTNDIISNKFKFPPELHAPLLKMELANFMQQAHKLQGWTAERKKNHINVLVKHIQEYNKDFKLK